MSKHDGGSILGLSLRDYYVAHAPAEPQPWFEPVLPSAAGRWQTPNSNELSGKDLQDWNSDIVDTDPESCSDTLKDFVRRVNDAYDAKKAYEKECEKQRYIQWPLAWADEIIKALGASNEQN